MLEFRMQSKKAQILVITLVTMFMLSLISLSTSMTASQDTNQRINNEVYDQNYSHAEARILESFSSLEELGSLAGSKLTTFQNSFEKINPLASSISKSCKRVGTTGANCIITEDCLETNVTVTPKNSFSDFEITSSEAITVDLRNPNGTSYTDAVNMSWTGKVLWSITLIYKKTYYNEVSGYVSEYESVKGIYSGLSPGGTIFAFNNKTSNSFKINPLAFADGSDKVGSYKTASCTQAGCSDAPLVVRFRPIMLDGSNITKVSVSGTASMPAQSVEILSQTSNICIGENSPTPLLSVQYPVIDSAPALFDYVYFQR